MRNKLYYILAGFIVATVIEFTVIASANTTQAQSPMSTQLPSTFVAVGSNSSSNDSSSSDSDDSDLSSVQHCQVIHWVGNRIYTIKGGINMATHIMFPETAIDVIVGNKDLWREEHRLNHVFVKPTNPNNPEGAESTLTYIGDSNTSYEFILKRVPSDQATACVIVTKDGGMVNDDAWSNYQNRDKKIIQYLADRFEQQKKQIISQQQNALDKYRGTIYTGYKYKATGGWFGHNFVSNVYDDGRWTYIRVSDDNKGVMSIYGMLDGKKNLLQFTYDETTKMYRISGIYPQLILAYGKDTVIIDRQSA